VAYCQIVTTVAGTSWFFPPYSQTALSAPLGGVVSAAADPFGNLYIADPDNHIVVRLSPDGVVSTAAGNGLATFSGDGGPAVAASLNSPSSVAVDLDGTLYIADFGNNRVRRVGLDGIIRTFAGAGSPVSSGDDRPALGAGVVPYAIAIDGRGNLYIADVQASRVRRVTPDGTISRVAGSGFPAPSGDGGPAVNAGLYPAGLALNRTGDLFIADPVNHNVRRVKPDGTISTFAGQASKPGFVDNVPAVLGRLNKPYGLATNSVGELFIADSENHRIRKVALDGTISTVAGVDSGAFSGDGGPATQAAMYPFGVAVDLADNLVVADSGNERIRRVTVADQAINTIAGNGAFRFRGDGGPATAAALNNPNAICFDAQGNLYFADTGSHRVRVVSPDGNMSTFAGNGAIGYSPGIAPTEVGMDPYGVAADAQGNIYIADFYNNLVRKVSPDGTIMTIAGTGAAGNSGDNGPALSARLNGPLSVAVDGSGYVYVIDYGNNRVRRISPDGTITAFAGNGVKGFAGFETPALGASFNEPFALAVDGVGNVYIADRANSRIRMVSTDGRIHTVAGRGSPGNGGDGGLATDADLNQPQGVAVDTTGNIFISDSGNNRIRWVSAADMRINALAGRGVPGYAGDGGVAGAATFRDPAGLALIGGNLYVADSANNRIREILLNSPVQLNVSPARFIIPLTPGYDAPFETTVNVTSSVPGVAYSASTDVPWLTLSPATGSTPALLRVVLDQEKLQGADLSRLADRKILIAAPTIGATAEVSVDFSLVGPEVQQPLLRVGTETIDFRVTAGSGAVSSQFQVSNAGIGVLHFTVSPSMTSGRDWLNVTLSASSAGVFSPAAVIVTANPASLGPGLYQGLLTIGSDGGRVTVAVTLTVSAPKAVLLVSQTGLSYTAVGGGGAPLPQTFQIRNSGSGAMTWTASPSTLSGGGWLRISASSDTVRTPFVDASTVSVSADATGLAPGDYFGSIVITSPTADAPQLVTVALTVLDATQPNPGPEVRPSGVVFIAAEGGLPSSQDVLIGNVSAQPLTFSTGVSPRNPASFQYLPLDGSITPNQPFTLRVFPNLAGRHAGDVERGTITLVFSDGSVRTISVLTIITSRDALPLSRTPRAVRPLATCDRPMQVQILSPAPDFSASTGKAVSIEVSASDGCTQLTAQGGGNVYVSVFNGDSDITLKDSGNGRWTGTWVPQKTLPLQGQITVYAFAGVGLSVRSTEAHAAGRLISSSTPVLTSSGVQHFATGITGSTIAPGLLINIRGSNLADPANASTPPGPTFPVTWNRTQVLLTTISGSIPLPILYADPQRITVQVPYGLAGNPTLPMMVQREDAQSGAIATVVAEVSPGIFTVDGSGTGQAMVYRSDGATLAQPGTPAAAGESVTILCAGLGQVDPNITEGTAIEDPAGYATVQTVEVLIGGMSAGRSRATLVPNQPGRYQVRVPVPQGVSGDAVPVQISIAGQTSPPGDPLVTMAIQ
jgi:uncharacterized protein (TIGR03437 family)